LFVHADVYGDFVARLKKAYASVKIGDPLEEGVLIGPLIDEAAFTKMQSALEAAKAVGGVVHGGERATHDGVYVRPALVEMPAQSGPVLEETFAPILYVMQYEKLDKAIALHNAVAQGLSSSIFTNDVREAEAFIS